MLIALLVIGVLICVGIVWAELIWSWVDEHEPLAVGILGSGIVIAGWIWARRTILSMKRGQELEILLNLGHYWDRGMGMEIWAKIGEIERRKGNFTNTLKYYRDNYSADYLLMLSLPNFFEDVGWLVKSRYIELGKILALYSLPISRTYQQYEDWIKILRQEEKNTGIKPQIYDYFIWLASKARGK